MIWTRLYDPARTPGHWTAIIRAGEYAVFFLSAARRTARDLDGRAFAQGEESVAICSSLDEAIDLANSTVARHPELCAEIYDHHGKSGEPVRLIYDPSVRGKYPGSRPYAKREAAWGLLIVAGGIGFVIYDARHELAWLWGYIVGIKLLLVGGNFLVRGLIGLYEHRT